MNRTAMDSFIDQIDEANKRCGELEVILQELIKISPMCGQTRFNIDIMALQNKAKTILGVK